MLLLNRGFNYSQDGPGNRLVYHMQGCNFYCPWCSNADSIPIHNKNARAVSVDEILDEVLRSRMMFFDGGGVTFTGGECTLQTDELLPLLKKLQENNISTCIETNGSIPALKELANYIDYLIVDLKLVDEEKHMHWTGQSNKAVKENIAYFLESGRQIHIRIPVINGVNNSPEEFADFFSRYNTENAVFEFLPYHEYGKDKWQDSYQMKNAFVTADDVKKFVSVFNDKGLKTVTT